MSEKASNRTESPDRSLRARQLAARLLVGFGLFPAHSILIVLTSVYRDRSNTSCAAFNSLNFFSISDFLEPLWRSQGIAARGDKSHVVAIQLGKAENLIVVAALCGSHGEGIGQNALAATEMCPLYGVRDFWTGVGRRYMSSLEGSKG